MPKEIPGFYYDEAKNRYFPYKGPIPGSSSSVKPPPSLPPQLKEKDKVDPSREPIRINQRELLQSRELSGNVIISRRGKISFQAEYRKKHSMQPMIWKYKNTKKMANISLEHAVTDVVLPHGIVKRDVLLSGGANGMIQLHLIGKVKYGYGIGPTHICKAYRILPHDIDQIPRSKELLKQLASSYGATSFMESDVSCIKVLKKPSREIDGSASNHFVVTTLGSDHDPGSVNLLDLSAPLNFGTTHVASISEVATFRKTIWTVDCDPEGRYVVIGYERGAARVNVENAVRSTVLFTCRSDVLSVEFDQSGNNVLCGMRNGAVSIVDTRQKPINWSKHNSNSISLRSSICCLKSLKLTEQYFLASSMDGSIKLYDQRLIQKGPVQSYEGNVNTHTRIELGVDPSEKIVMSGGEDCYVRTWDIKSGKMLYKEKFMNSVPTAVCWPGTGDFTSSKDYRSYWDDHHFGAWLGSYEGIYYMDWL